MFVAVAELGTIRQAAERIGRTPSAVSMTLQQLEDQLGGRLFRGDRKNRLTALGDYVLEAARDELGRYDRTVAAMRAFARNEIGRVDIAAIPSVAVSLLPDIIRSFTRRYPGIELDLRDTDTVAVHRLLENGTVEVGVAGRPAERRGLSYRALFRYRFTLVCRVDDPLAMRGSSVSWRDLHSRVLIDNGASATIETPAWRALSTQARLMVRNVPSLIALVRAGVGITLLPRLAVVHAGDDIACLELADRGADREVGLVTRSATTLSPAARAFAQLLERSARSTGR